MRLKIIYHRSIKRQQKIIPKTILLPFAAFVVKLLKNNEYENANHETDDSTD